jgi:hypothetical protein
MIRKNQVFMVGLFIILFITSANQLYGQQSTEGPAWMMKTEMVIVDNCPISCSCLFGLEPHHGHCRFIGTAHIVEGDYKGTSLNGVNWAVMGEFSGKSVEPQYHYSAYYIDAGASKKQKMAMREILSGAPFSTMGEQLGIKETSIEIKSPDGENKSYLLSLGDIGEFSVSIVYGNDTSTPLKVLNPVYPFPAKEIIIGSASGKFNDHGKELNLENNSGEISEFTLSGN